MNEVIIRLAKSQDISSVKRIADAHRVELGFVMRPTLELAVAHDWLLVAEQDGNIVGFCNYRHCTRVAGRTTIYEIVVSSPHQGIGRQLITAIIQDALQRNQSYLHLKCVQGLDANTFYAKMGFALVGIDEGKKRSLNIYKYDLGRA